MTATWMGYLAVRKALSDDRLMLTGNRPLAGKMQSRPSLSPLAKVERKACWGNRPLPACPHLATRGK